jgi:hypothetical protein
MNLNSDYFKITYLARQQNFIGGLSETAENALDKFLLVATTNRQLNMQK